MTQRIKMHSHPRRRSASINLHHGGDPAGLTPSLTITGIEPALTIIVYIRFLFRGDPIWNPLKRP